MTAEPPSRAGVKELAKSASNRVVGPRATASLISGRRRAIDWSLSRTAQGQRSRELLSRTHNSHAGETCVIMGNGPSLNDTPLEHLRNVPTFGLNRIYMMFDKMGFATTYHVVVNSYVVSQKHEDFVRLEAPLFTTWKNRKALKTRTTSTSFLPSTNFPTFGKNLLEDSIWEGATVTYVAMQVAFHMGFSRVALVGVDHRFSDSGPAHKLVESRGPDLNHFDPNYFGPGFKWQLPDLETSEIAYDLARTTFAADGREVVDCTVGGALQVFPKADLRDVI